MTANKMPEMPEAVAWIHSEDLEEIHEGAERRDAPAFASPDDVDPEYRDGMSPLYTAAQMRAMYLAGLEAAKACVPGEREDGLQNKYDWGVTDGFNQCILTTLTNLTALEQEAKK